MKIVNSKAIRYTLLSIFIVGTGIVIAACGSDSDDDDDDTSSSSTVKYADVSAMISASCGGSDCHSTASGANGNIGLATEALVKTNATASAAAIRNGSMPKLDLTRKRPMMPIRPPIKPTY